MSKLLYSHLAFVCLILIYSCTPNKYNGVLQELEALSAKQPDSALILLEQTDIKNFKSAKQKAKYAFLHTKIRNNNNLYYRDSLMNLAESYYMKYGTDTEKAQILYCIGNSMSSIDSFAIAVDYYSKAQIYANKSGIRHLIAAINNALGYSYSFQMDFEDALRCFSISADYLTAMGLAKESLLPRYNKISSLNKLGRNEEALNELHTAQAIAESINDTTQVIRFISLEATIVSQTATNAEEARAMLEKLMQYLNKSDIDNIPIPFYNVIGFLYYSQGNFTYAKKYLLMSLEHKPPLSTRLGCYFTLSRIAEAEGNWEDALMFERNVTSLQDTIFQETKKSVIQASERKYRNAYLQHSYDALSIKHHYSTILYSLTIAFILLLLTLFVIYYKKRIRTSRKEIEDTISYMDTLRIGYTELQNKYDCLKNDTEHLSSSNSQMLNLLGDRMDSVKQLLEMASQYESRPAVFYSKFKEHLKVSPQINIKWEEDIISITNLSYGNIISELKTEHPDMSVHELCYCALICLGFSQQSIRVLYDHTNMNSVYSLRTRIRTKLGIVHSNYSLDNYFKELLKAKNFDLQDRC